MWADWADAADGAEWADTADDNGYDVVGDDGADNDGDVSATMLLVTKTVAMMIMHETAAGDNNDHDDVDENADCDSWDDDEYMTVTAMTATTFVYPLVCCYKVTVVH